MDPLLGLHPRCCGAEERTQSRNVKVNLVREVTATMALHGCLGIHQANRGTLAQKVAKAGMYGAGNHTESGTAQSQSWWDTMLKERLYFCGRDILRSQQVLK